MSPRIGQETRSQHPASGFTGIQIAPVPKQDGSWWCDVTREQFGEVARAQQVRMTGPVTNYENAFAAGRDR